MFVQGKRCHQTISVMNHILDPVRFAPDGRRRVDADAPMLTPEEWATYRAEDLNVYADKELQRRVCERIAQQFKAGDEKRARDEKKKAERDAYWAFIAQQELEREMVIKLEKSDVISTSEQYNQLECNYMI